MGKYVRVVWLAVVGIFLTVTYMKFISCYKTLNDMDGNFLYIYTDSEISQDILEECHKYQTGCEIWNTGKADALQTEEMTHANRIEGNIAIAEVQGIKALNYHEIETLFQDRDVTIDVNLLKWFVSMISFCCLFCIMVCYICRNKKWVGKKWFYILAVFLSFLYLKKIIFSKIADFPVWALPGKWSDLEGWGILGKEIHKQILCMVYFKEYPIVCAYYEGVSKTIFYLFLLLSTSVLFYAIMSQAEMKE